MKPISLLVGVATAALLVTGCSTPTVTTPDAAAPGSAATNAAAPAESAPAQEAPAQEAPAAEQGTRENPYPLGSTITNDEWSITVNSYTADATAQVKEANMFNEDPAEGTTYALVNLTVTREGADEASPMFDVGVDYVTAAGNVVTRGDAFVVAPDALSDNELFTGASATGNIALQVPADDAGVLRVKAGMFDDGVFVATS